MSNEGIQGEEDINHLWDISYLVLYQILAGDLEGHKPEDVEKYVKSRQANLNNCIEPFGKPNKESRSKVESGVLTVDGNVKVQVPPEVRQIIWGISAALDIDEQNAFILWKSFIRNRGLASVDLPSDEEIIEYFSDHYYEEKLSVLRCIIPLLRANSDSDSPFHILAKEALGQIMPKPRDFAVHVAKQYLIKTSEPFPSNIKNKPRGISNYVKRNIRLQFVMLEVLYWTLLECSLFDGSLTEEIYTIAYKSDLGNAQRHSSMLLDEEGVQLLTDMETLWAMILVELLQTMQLLMRSSEDTTSDSKLLVSFPEYVQRTLNVVYSNVTPRHGPILLGWAAVLSHISTVDISERPVYEDIASKASEQYHQLLGHILQPEFNLFQSMRQTLLTSPLFVPSTLLTLNSPVTNPNALDLRFTFKSLIIGLTHLINLEFLPDFDAFIDLWIALFGTGDEFVAARISRHYWDYDWKIVTCRRAIFDVTRSRFPVQFKPLVRLLRSMCGTGNTREFGDKNDEDRTLCATYVYHYFRSLPTFTQVIPITARSGPNAGYEALINELYSGGVMYRNTHTISFPGGSVLPRGSSSRLLSSITDPNDPIIVEWKHQYSGWRLLLAALRNYIRPTGTDRPSQSADAEHRRDITLTLGTVGMDDAIGDETVIDALELIRCVIDRNSDLATELMQGLDSGDNNTSEPDLVEVTIRILEDALQRSTNPRISPPSTLIISATGVLTALISLPVYAYRVWPFFRSNHTLFGTDNHAPITPSLLAAERITGKYPVTLNIIALIRALLTQTILSLLTADLVMQPVKETVLLRAVKFIHKELWVEHTGWKYVSIAERFEISRQISLLYSDILQNCPPPTFSGTENSIFSTLTSFIMDAFVFRANAASINPLVNSINTGEELMNAFTKANRHYDSLRLLQMLESHLQLVRLLLERKRESTLAGKLSLLEQALCVGAIGGTGTGSVDNRQLKLTPIDVITGYVQYRFSNSSLAFDSIRLLSTLCRSLACSQVTPPSIVAHLSDAEGTAASFIRILRHPWDDLQLRVAIWHFVSLTVNAQPALSNLFIRGKFHIPTKEDVKGKGKGKEHEKESETDSVQDSSAVKVACEALGFWDTLWDANPFLLATILEFLEIVWPHAPEHKLALEPTRTDSTFWEAIAGIARRELGPGPEWTTSSFINIDNQLRSDCHSSVQVYAYRTKAKAHALRILASDIEFALSTKKTDFNPTKLLSYQVVQPCFGSFEELNDYMGEAIATYYSQQCHEAFVADVLDVYPSLKGLQNTEAVDEREYGDNYIFPAELARLRTKYSIEEESEAILQKLANVNLNLSLAESEVSLTRSWRRLLQVACPILRSNNSVREYALAVAESVSGDIAMESRIGTPMITIHSERLWLLLALMEVTWFIPPSTANKTKHISQFVTLISHIRELITSVYFPPGPALRLDRSTRFYRTLVQMIHFCARKAREAASEPKAYTSEQRLTIGSFLADSIRFIIEGLRDTFDLAKASLDAEIDRDMELLVLAFEQCTRSSMPLPSSLWLSKCHEVDLIRASLDLLVKTDFTGLRNLTSPPIRRHPLYARHILFFHLLLARSPSSAERLANDGVVLAYANVNIREALSTGTVETTISEFPGERNPSHSCWCTMLAILSNVTNVVGPNSQVLIEEVIGLIHLYGSQITQALTWHVGEPLTLPFLEELGQIVSLFNAVADSRDVRDAATQSTLHTYAERVSELLQDLNYSLSHPNHLASLLDAVTAEERSEIEKDTKNLSVESFTELLDGSKRPLLAAVIQKTLCITRDIMLSLVTVSAAETILINDVSEWPSGDPLLTPISKVAPGDTASIGTLLELGTCAVDILKHLSGTSLTEQKSTTAPTLSLLSFSPKTTISAALQLLETTLIYGVTQMTMWIAVSEKHDGLRQMEMDDMNHERDFNEKQRRRPSVGVTNLARVEESTADLKALLLKAKPVMDKTIEQLRLERQNLAGPLMHFLEKKIRAADGR